MSDGSERSKAKESSQSAAIVTEPRWWAVDKARQHDIPPVWRDWLSDPASLTEKLNSRCGSGIGVRLLRSEISAPWGSEAALLGGAKTQSVLVREVALECMHASWVVARSLILQPDSTAGETVADLGNRSLGSLLFNDRRAERHAFQFALLSQSDGLCQLANNALNHSHRALWARRTLFYYQDTPILVNEVFLPDLLDA